MAIWKWINRLLARIKGWLKRERKTDASAREPEETPARPMPVAVRKQPKQRWRMITEDKANYYQDANGTIRRTRPKVRKSKKERLRERWEDRERFPTTGRGHKDEEKLDAVKQYLRSHREGVTAIEVGNHVGVSQARATRLLDLLSGNSDDNSFLVYSDEEGSNPLYFLSKDGEKGRILC